MDNCLEGQVALITGGNAGIGKAIAKKFMEYGAELAIFGRNLERGESVAAEIAAEYGKKANFYQVDVGKTEDVKLAVNQVLEDFSGVDILVNNAGITRDKLMLKMKEADWDDVMNTNLKSAYNTCQALTRHLMKKRKGKIINISSVVGLTGNEGQVNYSASKAGMLGLTKSLAKELAARNICVNCIAPGYIHTEMTDELSAQQKDAILAKVPLKRLGSPDDIAHTALFLASPLADFLTGQVIAVDGGMVM